MPKTINGRLKWILRECSKGTWEGERLRKSRIRVSKVRGIFATIRDLIAFTLRLARLCSVLLSQAFLVLLMELLASVPRKYKCGEIAKKQKQTADSDVETRSNTPGQVVSPEQHQRRAKDNVLFLSSTDLFAWTVIKPELPVDVRKSA